MNIENLTNVEILWDSNLKNKLLIQIPHTHYHILCTYIKTKKVWNAYIIELTSTKRKQIGCNISKDTASLLIEQVLKEGQHTTLKNKKNFKALTQEFKQKIEHIINNKNNKNEKLQRSNLKTPRNRPR